MNYSIEELIEFKRHPGTQPIDIEPAPEGMPCYGCGNYNSICMWPCWRVIQYENQNSGEKPGYEEQKLSPSAGNPIKSTGEN